MTFTNSITNCESCEEAVFFQAVMLAESGAIALQIRLSTPV